MDTSEFQQLVRQKGRELYRDMPWRANTDPYYVLVSELMLQQTQVDRVVPKFLQFIAEFPDIHALADAPLARVIYLWNGLGYNRRAKFLHDTARIIVEQYDGVIPSELQALMALPGIGANTAGAIMAYAFDKPEVFVETNVRTVYFHHFFKNQDSVSDQELRTLVGETLEREQPRSWYQALMDYGAWLKKQGIQNIKQSTHYRKQSKLAGSVREMRGCIIKALTASDYTEDALRRLVQADERFHPALKGLMKDGLVSDASGILHLTK